MAIKPLDTQLDRIIVNTKERALAVIRQAISDTVEEAQIPVAKGGRMRVLTGFLRSSGLASLNAAPRGPKKGDPKGAYSWNGESINTALAKMKLGDAFYFGWTAHYAKYREARDGFLESAIMNWQINVNKAVNYYRKKDGV